MPFTLIKPVTDTITERLKNPVLGAFVIPWIFVNWAALLLLLFTKQDIGIRVLAFRQQLTIGDSFLSRRHTPPFI